MSAELTLQVNQSGAWRNVVRFDAAKLETVSLAAGTLAKVLGSKTTWRMVRIENGYAHVVRHDAEIRRTANGVIP